MPELPATNEVVIIGSGPAGLSCATGLARAGVENVIVLEREAEAGGAVRHCGHYPFGLREFHRLLRGPDYAALLIDKALQAGVKLYVEHTVVQLFENGRMLVSHPQGSEEIRANHVVIATGNRESSRSARFIGGERPTGVLNTGALQAMVYLNKCRPFLRPVILGSELVSFSALQTCRHAGIKPVAMIEQNSRVTAWKMASLAAHAYGARLYLDHTIKSIHGKSIHGKLIQGKLIQRQLIQGQLIQEQLIQEQAIQETDCVTSVEIEHSNGHLSTIECDGVIVTGQFLPEATLVRNSHLSFDMRTGGAVVDQYGRCSDSVYYSVGNATRSVETAGWCWSEGRSLAKSIEAAIATSTTGERVGLTAEEGNNTNRRLHLDLTMTDQIKYAVPQRIALGDNELNSVSVTADKLQIRFKRPVMGVLHIEVGGQRIWSKRRRWLPERRYLVPLPKNNLKPNQKTLSLVVEETQTPRD